MLQPGDHVGRYEIQVVVGEGGFGQVYRAWDPELERTVAIKELSHTRQTHEPAQYAEYLERFRLERRVQGQFQHPHIVSVYDLVQQDGDEYLVEEFVAGGTLHTLIKQEGRLSPERVVQIGVEMCQAIATAWEQDVVHRDIKPSNILLTEDGHAKLADFGVAQVGQMSQRTMSDSHHPGTPLFMSPEQEKGYGYLDQRSDLYALGLVLYQALTDKPFKRERVPVRQLVPDVPQKLEQVVMRALSHDLDDRYQHAAEFETDLRHALDKSRPAWLWWAGGALILLTLVVAGWLSARPSRDQHLPTPTASSTPTVSPSQTATLPPSPTIAPTATHTRTPTTMAPTATQTRSPAITMTHPLTSGATPTLTAATTPRPTPTPIIIAPRLVSPAGAEEIKTSQPTLRWEGELPNSSYGFRVHLRYGSGIPEYVSPILDEAQWTTEIPGSAVGEWRWSVSIVLRDVAQETVARSAEWTFYYAPFSGPSPPYSPLPLPLNSTFASPTP